MTERPGLSVVVASFRELRLLAQCLESLRPQCARHGAELIVARASRDSLPELAGVTEGCRVVAAPQDAGVPLLRGVGLATAQGEWVAITEDHCVADPAWLDALAAQRDPGIQVLGGSMGNARPERGTDCGAFFAEYGFYGARRGAGPGASPLVTEANAAYHHSVVADIAEWARAGCWENVIHDRLHAAGRAFRLVPDAVVRQNLTYSVGAFCRDRFEHGRAYAAVRSAGIPGWRRVALLAGTPLLPVVLAGRIHRAVRPEELRYWARGLPAMLTFLSAWAVGEAAGYAGGTAP